MIQKHHVAIASFVLAICAFLFLFTSNDIEFTFGLNNTPAENYQNVTVWTRVNITNAKPEIISLIVYDQVTGNPLNVSLSAGIYHQVDCNATVRDWNGMDDNITLNATFYHNLTSTYAAVNDNSSHYQNASCMNTTAAYGQNGIYKNYTCSIQVKYYALNGTWTCTIAAHDVKDDKNYTVYRSNTTRIGRFYALNVTDGIDYGEMAVGEYSPVRIVNVSNFGNWQINLTVQAYGAAINDGFAMICNSSISSTNISVRDQAFYTNTTSSWLEMINNTGAVQAVPNLTIPRRTDLTQEAFNNTYWQLWLDPNENPFGVCTGNVIFAATAAP